MIEDERNLTDADVKALSKQLADDFQTRFFGELGKGVWGIFWKALVAVMLIIVGWQVHRSGGIG